MLLIVSSAEVVEGQAPQGQTLAAAITVAGDEKCPRCWNFWIRPSSGAEVCDRCDSVLKVLA